MKEKSMKTKLFILGNGFDLMHGMPTSYSDFASFCQKKDKVLFDLMNTEFQGLCTEQDKLWSNFEDALGAPNLDFLLNEAKRNGGQIQYMERPIGVDYTSLKNMMSDWIASLSKSLKEMRLDKRICFDAERSLFLTFNYTNTLEDIYGIQSNDICHIHEKYDGNTIAKFVGYNWGHSKSYDAIRDDFKEKDLDIREPIPNDVKETIMYFGKRYDDGRGRLKVWFDSHQKEVKISDIIVIGHSMANVDYPYFIDCCNRFQNAKWHIFYFDENDLVRKRKSIVDLQLNDKVEFLKQ